MKEDAIAAAPIILVQPGDRVTKGGKEGQVISIVHDNAIILWDNGVFKEEPLDKLEKKKENLFASYMRKGKRI